MWCENTQLKVFSKLPAMIVTHQRAVKTHPVKSFSKLPAMIVTHQPELKTHLVK